MILSGEVLFVGDDDNAKMATGITINQGDNDDEILALKSSDVTHLMTNYGEADTFYSIQKQNATQGGIKINAFSTANQVVHYQVFSSTDNTVKSTSAKAPFQIDVMKLVGGGPSAGGVGADANLVVIRNSSTAKWLVDEDGDTWQTGKLTLYGASASHWTAIAGGIDVRVNAGGYYVCNFDQDNVDGYGVMIRGDMAASNEPYLNLSLGKPAGHLDQSIFTVMGSGIAHLGPYKDISGGINAKMTSGLTISQGGSDDEILAFKSTDVEHGYISEVDTDTYGTLRKASGSAGGLMISGHRDADAINSQALYLRGFIAENANAVKSTAGRGIITLYASQTSGDALADVVADGNLVAILARRSAANDAVWILDEDGDTWQDGSLTLGSTELSEADLVSLLALL
jgi:hypothetical protein